MNLLPNWKEVVHKAWSLRFIATAGVLSGIEVALPYIGLEDTLPRGVFSIISIFVTAIAFVSRIVVQKDISKYDA